MDETYRMLAKAHHDDLDREAARRALASKLPGRAGVVARALATLARVRRTRSIGERASHAQPSIAE